MAIKREKANYTIQSVSHALDILESFTKAESELGVTELSKRLGLHKNNVFRLLATLEHRGYIEQNKETENYRLGAKTLQIGSTFIDQRECRRQARPILEKLSAAVGETTVVAVLRGNKVVYMDSAETDKVVRVASRIGAMLPAHCTAVGKAQLAFLPSAEVERLYPENALDPRTDATLRSRAALMEELKKVAEGGIAWENEEADPDVRSVAVPVRDFSRNVVAAIGIVGPVSRLSDEKLARVNAGALLMEAGKSLSQRLGFSGMQDRK